MERDVLPPDGKEHLFTGTLFICQKSHYSRWNYLIVQLDLHLNCSWQLSWGSKYSRATALWNMCAARWNVDDKLIGLASLRGISGCVAAGIRGCDVAWVGYGFCLAEWIGSYLVALIHSREADERQRKDENRALYNTAAYPLVRCCESN